MLVEKPVRDISRDHYCAFSQLQLGLKLSWKFIFYQKFIVAWVPQAPISLNKLKLANLLATFTRYSENSAISAKNYFEIFKLSVKTPAISQLTSSSQTCNLRKLAGEFISYCIFRQTMLKLCLEHRSMIYACLRLTWSPDILHKIPYIFFFRIHNSCPQLEL